MTSSSQTLLDLFITNLESLISLSGVAVSDVSDHLAILLCIKKRFAMSHVQPSLAFQIITRDRLDKFRKTDDVKK